jgi:hypothetical protein
MELLPHRPAGLILLVGSILFLIAAFLPYSRVFAEPDPLARLEILHQKRNIWNIGQLLFALGSLITVLGLAILYFNYRASVPGNWVLIILLILMIGALLWSWHCIERMISPEGFVNGTLTPRLFLLYSIFTQAGLIFFGVYLLGTNLSGWLGWMLVGGTALISVLMIVFKDMPPFVYYVFTLVLAIKLLAGAGETTSI